MRHASLPEDAKHQITLPKEHHVTNLIVQHYHFASGHSGGEYVLSLQRSKFWVIRANSVLHKLLTNCFSCRGRQVPVCSQKMADLSKERVTRGQPPFSHVGIDFFGPFMVKQGRSQVKRYGCIESWEDLNPVFYIYLLYLTTTLKEQSVPTAAVIL